jgi:hypothetical protein
MYHFLLYLFAIIGVVIVGFFGAVMLLWGLAKAIARAQIRRQVREGLTNSNPQPPPTSHEETDQPAAPLESHQAQS